MATGQNLSPQLDPLPLPDETPVKVEEQRQQQNMQQAQRMPPGAGFSSRGGQMAYLANNILTGWMAGRHVKEQKELEKAKNAVTSSKSIYDTLAQTYSQNIESGSDKNSPEMQKLASDISSAWNNYVGTADKYTTPEEGKNKKGEKKGVGDKFKQALGIDIEPEMFRKGAVNILRQSGPPVLKQDQSPQAKATALEIEARKTTLEQEKKDNQRKNRWAELSVKDPKALTKDEQTELEGLERSMFPKSYEQKTRDDLMKKVVENGQSLSAGERELAEQMGILKPKVTNSVTWKDSKGIDWIIAMGPDGREVGRRSLGKGYIPPDGASIAQREFQNQINTLVSEYKKAYGTPTSDPNQLDSQAHMYALSSISGIKGFGNLTPMSINDYVRFKQATEKDKERELYALETRYKRDLSLAKNDEEKKRLADSLDSDKKRVDASYRTRMDIIEKNSPYGTGMTPFPSGGGMSPMPGKTKNFKIYDPQGQLLDTRSMSEEDAARLRQQYPGVKIEAQSN